MLNIYRKLIISSVALLAFVVLSFASSAINKAQAVDYIKKPSETHHQSFEPYENPIVIPDPDKVVEPKDKVEVLVPTTTAEPFASTAIPNGVPALLDDDQRTEPVELSLETKNAPFVECVAPLLPQTNTFPLSSMATSLSML